MAYPKYLSDKARQLRVERKLTIDELAERLALPRTTIYYWVRDLPIPYMTPARSRAQLRAARAVRTRYRRRREEAYAEGVESYSELSRDPRFREFVTLYIAEGYKRDRNRVSVGNSDVVVVQLMNRWILRPARNKVSYGLQYHADQNLGELIHFWSGALNVEPSLIRPQRKSNSNQLARRTWRSKHGVLTVDVGDTYLRARLQAWIDCLRSEWLDSLSLGA